MAQNRGMHRRHPGRGRPAGFRPFDRRQPCFEHRHGGIAEPRILIMRDLAAERRRRLLGIVVNEPRGQEQRLGVLREIGPDLTGMNQSGGRAIGSFHPPTITGPLSFSQIRPGMHGLLTVR
jgi:hypothetical protein